jgi:hypothetical protein
MRFLKSASARLDGAIQHGNAKNKKVTAFVLCVTFLFFALAGIASANEPWWHLLSGARPSYLPKGGCTKAAAPGTGKYSDVECTEKAVPANTGDFEKVKTTLVASALNVGDANTTEECVKLPASAHIGKYKDAACTQAASPADTGEFEKGVLVVDKLPAGLKALNVEGVIGIEHQNEEHLRCAHTSAEAMCVSSSAAPFDLLEVRVNVIVEEGASTGERNVVSVSGGGAPPKSISRPIRVAANPGEVTPLGLQDYELTPEEAGGKPATQAGSHPFQTTFTVETNQNAESLSEAEIVTGNTVGNLRDVYDYLPPGLIGNPQPFARCALTQFLARTNECPVGSVVGVVDTTISEPGHLGIITFPTPLYNLQPAAGEPAKFGWLVLDQENPVYIDTSVRTGSDYGITGEVRDIPQTITFLSSVVTFWGVPGAPEHNETRDGCLPVVEHSVFPCQPVFENSPPPFFELPTSCPANPLTGEPEPMQSSIGLDSWQQPGSFTTGTGVVSVPASEPLPALDGCNRLPFDPSIEVKPDIPDASSSTGVTVDVKVPQQESLTANGLGEADIRNTTVALPAGVAINPAGGDGLQACPDNLIGFAGRSEEPALDPGVSVPVFTPYIPGDIAAKGEVSKKLLPESEGTLQPGVNFCANASKIGTVKIKLPVIKEPLVGAVYLAPQEANPFGSLLAMYIVAEDPESGVLVKLPGEVQLCKGAGETIDGQTCQGLGQIITTFLNTPQAPAEEIELHFFGGEKAPLATPSRCGSYTTTTSITPWSTLPGGTPSSGSGPPATPSSTFQIEHGPGGGACPGASLPFKPSLTGGALNLQAGAFSPFTATMSRADGEQNLQSLEVHLPPGLLGILSSVELCPEPQANQGACGPNSLIGETTVSVGVGGHPFTVSGGKFYLTGPYNGTGGCTVGPPPGGTQSSCAPFGISFVVPAKAGPFDLEHTKQPNNHPACDCVIVRGKIEVNELTAAVTITSNPPGTPNAIPTSIEGIPLEIQHINATTTRGNFQFNPTNCAKMEVTGTIHSSENATDTLGVPFQVTNCANLKFEPKLAVSTQAKTSKANGASLSFKFTNPNVPQGTDANYAKFKVELPVQLPSRLTTLQKACTAAQFNANPAGCPAASVVGHMKVLGPVLPVPVEGPMYFVSNGGEAFPNLIVVLQGYGVTVHLVGDTFISKSGVTSSTFKAIPDFPFSSAEVTLPEGKFSALAANGNLCAETTTKLVSKKVTVRVKGHKKTVTKKVKETVAAPLAMPTEWVAQNGAEIHQTTPIRVIGCGKVKKAKKAKHGSKKHGKKR